MSQTVGTTQEASGLTVKQWRAALLVGQGYSQEAAAREIGISLRTFYRWRQIPGFKETLVALKQECLAMYERSFTSMLPEVAQKHRQLLNSESEAIAMRAVDSAHGNYARCVRDKEAADELAELKALCRTLMDRLEAQSIP